MLSFCYVLLILEGLFILNLLLLWNILICVIAHVFPFSESARILGPPLAMPPQLRSPTPAGAPIIIAPRMANLQQMNTAATSTAGLLNGGPPPLVSPADASLIYGHYDPYAAMAHAALLEYPGLDQTGAGTSYMR